MAVDRKFIGQASEDRFVTVETGQLLLFAKATGETSPVYTDEAAARAAGHPALPAPPTFAFSLGLLAPAQKGSILEMGVNIGNVLHGEQRFDYHAPIHAGDRIRLKTTTMDIYEKKNGALEFIVQDTTAHNQNDELCVSSRSVIVVRR
jgi:acyl dehydratase